ncbi:MAG: hypothetical protein PVI84_08625, partial [Syntrophobacterales bacterium]
GSRAFAAGGGSFPWPSSPGQGKNNILCVLCASVVNFLSWLHGAPKCRELAASSEATMDE